MKELLSKEVVHAPLVELRARYPQWLQQNASRVPAAEMERFVRQYESIQRLCDLYELEGDHSEEILTEMTRMQENGQPPEELARMLTPDLPVDANGNPSFAPGDDKNPCPMQ